MKRQIIIVLIMFLSVQGFAQTNQKEKRRFRAPIWLTHSSDTDIAGVSLGFFPNQYIKDFGTTRTFGLRVEAFPLSFLYFMAPRVPVSYSDEDYNQVMKSNATQQIYGINISTGTFETIDAYGISITGFMHYSRKNNGIAIAGLTNSIERANGLIIGLGGSGVYRGNGIMISGVWGNGAKYFNGIQISAENHIVEKGSGIQIGIFNNAKNFRGVQIGLWNKNDKRAFPIINWQFKK